MIYRRASMALAIASVLALPSAAFAAVSAEEAAKLGNELTCVGAERAGNAEGTIPEYTGKYLGKVPGWNIKPHSGDHPIDPYADEKPRLVLTAANYKEHADKLSEGQKAMFEKYPDTYRMEVYPTHRDFRYPEFVCERAKENALTAKVVDDGYGIDGISHNPFPIPKTAMEALWNHQLPYRDWTEESTRDIVTVGAGGSYGYGRSYGKCLALSNDPNVTPHSKDGISAMCRTEVVLPTRDSGNTSMAHEPYNYLTSSRTAWSYNAGTRRVRLAPGYGYDQSLGGSNGTMTIDEDRLFNGAPDRYNWELKGKKEVFIPANGYKTEVADLKYKDLLTPNHADPKYIRYELRRVWILEATLKETSRHLYGKRRLYLDEDTWHAVMADNYDTRGNLWKFAFLNTIYHPDMSAWRSGASFYHDLNTGDYVGYNLTNERRISSIINKGDQKKSDYTPDRLRAQGR